MKLKWKSGVIAHTIALGFIASNAWATINLSPGLTVGGCSDGNQTSTNLIETYINTNCGVPLPNLYKADVGAPVVESGAFAGAYSTVFSSTPSDPSAATITFNGGAGSNIMASSPVFILVKDGNQIPAWYLFQTAWNGQETIELSGFWPQQGAISHVAIYGTHVPDGGTTVILLGGALVGLQAMRRKFNV